MASSFYEDLSTLMYPSGLLHRFGVNGKVSGSIGAIGEMGGVAAVLHGPKGCAFHYRNSARRRHQLFHPLYSTDLGEEEIITGGCEKLYATVMEVYRRHAPPLIMVIPTPISDILSDDIAATVRRLREEQGIPVVSVRSELFSHRDKGYARRRVRELAKQPVKGAQNLEMELLGCGFTEALYALVDQVMEPQPVMARRINLETVGWGAGGRVVLREIADFLSTCGVEVGCWIPSAPLEQLRQAPSAALNVVKRVRWAKHMKEKFGTDYLHLGGAGRHHGLEGIVRFYQDIGEAMGLSRDFLPQIDEAYQASVAQAAGAKAYLGGFRCALVCRGLQMAPHILRQHLEDYGLHVTDLILIVTPEEVRSLQLEDTVYQQLLSRIRDVIRDRDIAVRLNPDGVLLREIFSAADFVLGATDVTMEGLGAPLIPSLNDNTSLSFASYVRSANRLAERVRARQERPHLLLGKLGFEGRHYPMLPDTESLAAREMWFRMWLTRKEDGQ